MCMIYAGLWLHLAQPHPNLTLARVFWRWLWSWKHSKHSTGPLLSTSTMSSGDKTGAVCNMRPTEQLSSDFFLKCSLSNIPHIKPFPVVNSVHHTIILCGAWRLVVWRGVLCSSETREVWREERFQCYSKRVCVCADVFCSTTRTKPQWDSGGRSRVKSYWVGCMFGCQVRRGSLFKTEEESIILDYCSLQFYANRRDGPSQKIFMTATWAAGCRICKEIQHGGLLWRPIKEIGGVQVNVMHSSKRRL